MDQIDSLSAVWVMTGHRGQPLTKEDEERLNLEFEVDRSFSGVDTWAKLFVRKRLPLMISGGKKVGRYRSPRPGAPVQTNPVELTAGDYTLYLYGYGDKSAGEYPKLRLLWDGRDWKEFTIGPLESYNFPFSLPETQSVEFTVVLAEGEAQQGPVS